MPITPFFECVSGCPPGTFTNFEQNALCSGCNKSIAQMTGFAAHVQQLQEYRSSQSSSTETHANVNQMGQQNASIRHPDEERIVSTLRHQRMVAHVERTPSVRAHPYNTSSETKVLDIPGS